ncbi:MAG: 4a-hydroxytetrahydrobiopterin dehydratase [Alphaproteobacteria bacterium]|jgi:4a-hydroxytetrahydrobiopterin dehydratase|nr:4a-hydroxytetrahydrobiopterin dehydratase [Alphaproteobacteria bacterium]MDP7222552.1 4a-hydroxytetrahydrobiopterin dehydratase [Alphaproteobacteria bacterium]
MTNDIWTEKDDALHAELKFKDFVAAFGFLSEVAILMEKHNHHAEIYNVYNTVKLKLTTHDAGDVVTEKDKALAAEITKRVGRYDV